MPKYSMSNGSKPPSEMTADELTAEAKNHILRELSSKGGRKRLVELTDGCPRHLNKYLEPAMAALEKSGVIERNYQSIWLI